MSLFEQFATDETKENDGVVVEYGTNADGTIISFTLSNAGKSNKAFVRLLGAKLKPYQRQLEMKTADNSIMERVMMEVFVGAVLKGWNNVQDETGSVIPYSKENAIQLFNKLPRLYDDLDAKSKDISLFRVETLDNEAKN
jgi:hypothetical protein